ncbi:MAG: serine/threonine protein kinase [Labilithrix sp.]|nr:serine/threonine protein kinase [Labilithrix sp.]
MSVPDALGLVSGTVDRIRFDECVDVGGFGTIYRGRHLDRAEAVAVKCLRLTRLVNLTEPMRASIVARFREETAILHHLSHGTHDIVRCLGSGQLFAPSTGEPVPYMVLEWIEGRTLAADLADRRARGVPGRTLRETLDLIESAALAIAHAHAQNIVHRDIKPANLMLSRTHAGGLRLKVLDFGLAKILSDEPGAGRNLATADGVQLYSVAYCAPEQLSPSVGEIGPWTDIYSLALVMLEVMRGEKIGHPLSGSLRASSLGLDLPPAVEALLARAVSQNPRERPADASAFWSELRELTKQSVPPVSDASALAATAYDGDVAAAMSKVRAAAGNANAKPAMGTMLMANAPSALQRIAAHSAGMPGPHIATAPLAPPRGSNAVTAGIVPPPSPLAASFGPGVASPVAITPPGAVPAAIRMPSAEPSRAPAVQPPPPNGTALAGAQPTPRVPSVPPPPALGPAHPPKEPRERGPGLLIALLVLLVLGVAATAGWMLLRPR